MANDLFAQKFHPLWALPLLATLVWHVAHTILALDPQYLFFVCYSANLLLGLGLVRRSALLVGIGFGWLLLAFPLWLYDAVLTGNWEASCTLFHLVGLAVGGATIRAYRLPRLTWACAVGLGLALLGLARLCTDASLNVNAAFRVYAGWEWLYPNYPSFLFATLFGFALFFYLWVLLHNRCYALPEEADHGG